MEVYLGNEDTVLESIENIPFDSEEDIEEMLYKNKTLMGDQYPFTRQAQSGDRKHIPDILAVDDNGTIYVVEIKNARPKGEEVLMQALRYVHWIKKNPAEIKMIWIERKNEQDEDTIFPEPDWNSIDVGIMFVAPVFDPQFVEIVRGSLSIPIKFLTVKKYRVGEKEIIITDRFDRMETTSDERGLPTFKAEYSWKTYLETVTDEKGIESAKKLFEQTQKVLEDIGLNWLKVRFNKYYIAFKNGGRNVLELYFTPKGVAGLSFHLPMAPPKMKLNLPEEVIHRSSWNEDYKIVYIPVVDIGVSVEELIPLFTEAKKYRT
ncbi:MAG: hypothetical protein BAJATHORv1_20544 [Candidatus Thorarchaeota archaeon]|nr:MAG: hypothetical protein BAJATHORv1_20544 [Candidatus Thorarchaeota archaeon]